MTGRRSFDVISSDAGKFDGEITLSLEDLKAQVTEEYDDMEDIPHVWPVHFSDHGMISSGFGTRDDPFTGEIGAYHAAVDLADKQGSKIHASASGVVVEATESEGFGLTILIDHGNGFETRYSHCNSLLVGAGDQVKQGQIIATMGDTGRTTGVHLDFRVYLNGNAIDPMTVLDEQ